MPRPGQARDPEVENSRVVLLEGEEVTLADPEELPAASDEEINNRYASGAIRIVSESARYSLAGILQMLQETLPVGADGAREPRYELDPEYQRRHRWTDQRKSRLIESFLMNVPVPPVFLYEREFARFEVMDGRQRLTALSEFYDNKFALTGLQYWPELNGRLYNTLPGKVRDGIDRRYISSIILLKESDSTPEQAAQLKKMVFERLNSGGVALSSQETRNAVYHGPLNVLCIELSTNADFRAMWGIPAEVAAGAEEEEDDEEQDISTNKGRAMYQRMDDVELVLRFFAYRQLHLSSNGLNRISAFLDRFLVAGNAFPPAVLDAYKTKFVDTISLLRDLLGSDAYKRLKSSGEPKGKAAKIVYDPIMYVASQYCAEPQRSRLLAQRNLLLSHLGAMYTSQADLFSGRRTNTVDSERRNVEMTKAFAATLPADSSGDGQPVV